MNFYGLYLPVFSMNADIYRIISIFSPNTRNKDQKKSISGHFPCSEKLFFLIQTNQQVTLKYIFTKKKLIQEAYNKSYQYLTNYAF